MNIKTSESVKINLLINSDQSDMLNSELIETVNSWWDKPDKVNNDIICKLLNVSMIKPEKGFGLDFDEIRRGELLLDSVFKSIDADNIYSVETAVLLLDSIYHTRLQSPLRTAGNIQKRLQDDDLIRKIMEAKELDDIVDCVNIIASIDKAPYQNNNYIYSFATKFCNRLNPVVFPIFDRYVASLLYYYTQKNNFFDFTQKSLGNYKNFLNVYKIFIEKYQQENLNFKQIDIFMWTYGKILTSTNTDIRPEEKLKLFDAKFYMTSDEWNRIKKES